MQNSYHSGAIPADAISTMETTLGELLKVLTPFATPLTADERHNLLKMGPKTFEFVELAHTLAQRNPELLTKSFDMEAFDADWQDAHNLMGAITKARQLAEILEDIRMAAGSDALHHALDAYADVKAAAARNIPEAKTVFEQLKAVYPARNRKHRIKDEGNSPKQA